MAWWDFMLDAQEFVSWDIMFDILGITLIVALVFFYYFVYRYSKHEKFGVARSS